MRLTSHKKYILNFIKLFWWVKVISKVISRIPFVLYALNTHYWVKGEYDPNSRDHCGTICPIHGSFHTGLEEDSFKAAIRYAYHIGEYVREVAERSS